MKILVAEDDAISRRVLEISLRKWGHEVVVTTDGISAFEALQADDAPRLAILDWMMPGLSGVDVCRQVRQLEESAPVYIILLTAMTGSENIVEGLEAGADDYLSKPFDKAELKARLRTGARIVELQINLAERVRQLEAAIVDRQLVEEQLRNLTLTDDLTGLYNTRGFYTLAHHQLKVTRRLTQDSLLIYADMDGLKQINDVHGHMAGSTAISSIAEILRQTFRESDIIGRLGGDEFAILTPNVAEREIAGMMNRLAKNLQTANERNGSAEALGLSIGTVAIKHDDEATIKELIAQADAAMYQDKRRRKCRVIVDGDFRSLINEPVAAALSQSPVARTEALRP